MRRSRYQWQGVLLGIVLAVLVPLGFLWLRIGLLNRGTRILGDPVLLGLALVLGVGGGVLCRKTRLLPLCAVVLWILWVLIPTGGGSLEIRMTLLPGIHGSSVEMALSVLLGTAILWSLFSIPAMAEFLTDLLPVRRRSRF